jgi:hypothetical protein
VETEEIVVLNGGQVSASYVQVRAAPAQLRHRGPHGGRVEARVLRFTEPTSPGVQTGSM